MATVEEAKRPMFVEDLPRYARDYGVEDMPGHAAAYIRAGGPPTYADLCEIALRRAGRPCRSVELIAHAAAFGKFANSLHVRLVPDEFDRFENLGWGVWALAEWPEEIKAPYRKG